MICPKHDAPYDDANPCIRCTWESLATEPPTKTDRPAPVPVVEVDRPGLAKLSLLELIPALSPQFSPPTHLADWCALLERSINEAVRGLCSVPIRHYKTETTVHGIVWMLMQDPTLRIMFLTHSFEAAAKWGKRIRQLAQAADVRAGVTKGTYGPTKGWDTIAEWRNESGGGVVVMSADQSKIGYDCHVLIVDDAIDEHDAQDPKKREEVDESISFYTARCMRRGQPGPALIVASRFHPDDPTGRRLSRRAVAWTYLHHMALLDEGLVTERAFAPEVWGVEALQKVRAELAEKDPTERTWWAQFQNDPRAVGGDLFREPLRYTTLPDLPFRMAYGADFAFTQGATSDYFALVVARVYGRKVYVTEVYRHKIDAHQIESTIRMVQNKHGRGVVWSYQSGPEVGLTNILVERGLPVARMPARYNKLVRAERTIKRWNDGDVLLPHESAALWAPGFMSRIAMFRGNDKDDGDDEIDALVSLCDGAVGGAVALPTTCGKPGYSGL